MPDGIQDGVLIETLYGPHYLEEDDTLVYIESTIRNEELLNAHTSPVEKANTVAASITSCWTISKSIIGPGCRIVRVSTYDLASSIPDRFRE